MTGPVNEPGEVTDQAVVAVTHVTRRFRLGAGVVTALDDVSVAVHLGELAVAAGPSGSGKTTLLSVIAGIESTDSGDVVTGPPLPRGVTPRDLPWRHLAFVPQSQALLPELTVAENIDLPARLDPGAPDAWPVADLLALLHLDHLADRYPDETSGGEQQRAALAQALRLRPMVLLADEPTGHQDRDHVVVVTDLLRRHAYAGHVVLIASHDQAVIGEADRVVILADGRVVEDFRR